MLLLAFFDANEILSEMRSMYSDLAPSDYHLFQANEENARWARAEIRIRYRGAISRSSMA